MNSSTIQSIRRYFFIAGLVLASTTMMCPQWGWGQAESLTAETELLGILTGSAEESEKAMACKRLAVYGSEACVSEVSKLLADPRLASWARITLEAIAGDQSKAALRQAAESLDGLLLVGAINSIGTLRDEQAVELLSKHLNQGSESVAAAAALALGRIGTDQALAVLKANLQSPAVQVRSAVAEGCVYIADQLLASNNASGAAELYDLIRQGDFAQQRIVEATRGAILARGDAGVPLLVEHLSSNNRRLFAVALQTAREVSSDQLGPALVAELTKAPADRAALIVEALSELKGKSDQSALYALVASGSKEVRLAAINSLGRIGDVRSVEPLLQAARQAKDLQAAVRAALVALPDQSVDAEILKRLPSATEEKQVLIEAVGLRQLEATDLLVKTIDSKDEKIRAAAIEALGQTVPQEKLATLVGLVTSPKQSSDLGATLRALKAAAVRMPDREACAATLSQAMESAPEPKQIALLEIIGAVGGTKALQTVAQHAAGTPAQRDAATRLLGEWATADAAPVIWELHQKETSDKFQERLIKGYIRVARQFVVPEEDRVKMCRQALQVAKLKEQKSLFEIVKKFPGAGMLQFAVDSLNNPNLKQDAQTAIDVIRPKLADNAEAQKILQQLKLQ